MKYILLLFIATIYSCDQSNLRVKKTPQNIEFSENGKVRKIIEYNCSKINHNNEKIVVNKSSCRIIRIKEYSLNGVLLKDAEWKYNYYPERPDNLTISKINDLGQKISSKKEMMIGDEIGVTFLQEFKYNDAGFVVEKKHFTDGVYTHKIETDYDEYNCPIKEIHYNKDEISHYYIFENDHLNRIIKSSYFTNNTLNTYIKFDFENDNDEWHSSFSKYNYDDKLIESTVLKKPEKVLVEKYYDNGRIKFKHILSDNKLDVYLTFDENGNLIERKEFDGEQFILQMSWEYRKDGALLKESYASNVNLMNNNFDETIIYKRDNLGNWTEKIVLNNANEIIDIRARDLEYY
jgi:hypothetical protein